MKADEFARARREVEASIQKGLLTMKQARRMMAEVLRDAKKTKKPK